MSRFSLKNLYLVIWGIYHRSLFMRSSQDLVLQDGSAGLFQFLPNQYGLLREVGPKIACFSFFFFFKWRFY